MATNTPGTDIATRPVGGDIQGFKNYLMARGGRIEEIAAQGIDAKRVALLAVKALMDNPDLRNCTGSSLFKSVLTAAELGVEMNTPLGECAIVRYGQEAKLMLMYRGMISLSLRSGGVEAIYAVNVFDGDEFSVTMGTDPAIVHVPNYGAPRDWQHLVASYAVARVTGCSVPMFEVMTRKEVEATKNRSRAKGSGPWTTDALEMARKCPVRRLWKYLPSSPHMRRAAETDADTPSFGGDAELSIEDIAEEVPQHAQEPRTAAPNGGRGQRILNTAATASVDPDANDPILGEFTDKD